MKKTFVKIMMVSAACIMLTAATTKTTQAQPSFGFQLGANLANVSGSDVSNNSMLVGINGGVLVRLGINDNFAIQPGVLYSMKGDKQKEGDSTINNKSSYIEIPINARYQFQKEGGFNVFAGPYVGFLMSAKSGDTDVKSYFKSTDFGLNIGLGYELESGLGISVQYGLGLSSIAKSVDVGGTTISPSIKNAVIGINLSYALGKK